MRLQVNLNDPLRRRLFVMYCYGYLVLGLATLGMGVYLLAVNRGQIGWITVIGGFLVLFGVLRGGNAIYQLVRMNAASSATRPRRDKS